MEHELKLEVNYLAPQLDDDPDFQGDGHQYTMKKFRFTTPEELEDMMDNIKIYMWNFYRDEKVRVLEWNLTCDQK